MCLLRWQQGNREGGISVVHMSAELGFLEIIENGCRGRACTS